MYLQKLSAWLLTDSGKKLAYYAAGTATTGILVASYLPHTLGIGIYKKIVHLYNHGTVAPLPKKLQDRFQKALNLLEVQEFFINLYQPFHVYGFDVMSAGTSYSKFGVIVGLPINYTYDRISDVDRSKIIIKDHSVFWESADAQKFLSSLVLSENAQIYSMAREIKYRQGMKPLLDPLLASSSFF